jgi:hypothetical protein
MPALSSPLICQTHMSQVQSNPDLLRVLRLGRDMRLDENAECNAVSHFCILVLALLFMHYHYLASPDPTPASSDTI